MRVLTLDIETMANEGYFWSPLNKYIGSHMMTSETVMISFSAKWLGTKQVTHINLYNPDIHQILWDLIEKADAIITYNGDGFDFKHIQREIVKNGLKPLKPIASLDLYKFVKKTFKLPYNKLEYVAQYFLGETKLETGGFDLWTQFMAGDAKAIKLMQKYNDRDVVVTEKLYTFLKPYMHNHPFLQDVQVDFGDKHDVYECQSCGGLMEAEWQRRTRCYAIRLCRCTRCGHWQDGKRKKL